MTPLRRKGYASERTRRPPPANPRGPAGARRGRRESFSSLGSERTVESTYAPQPLPLLAEETFSEKPEIYAVVSFLNKALKARGLVFGYSERQGTYTVSVYATRPWDEEGDR